MKWEYKTIRIDAYVYSCSTQDMMFNNLGEEGWEMVGFDLSGACDFIFKRVKEESL